jgi:hypothetical protein
MQKDEWAKNERPWIFIYAAKTVFSDSSHDVPLVRQVRGWYSGVELQMSRRQGAEEGAYLLAKGCCEMSASVSRRDNIDRSVARSAWEASLERTVP